MYLVSCNVSIVDPDFYLPALSILTTDLIHDCSYWQKKVKQRKHKKCFSGLYLTWIIITFIIIMIINIM